MMSQRMILSLMAVVMPSLCSQGQARAKTTIVVNHGDYPSAQAAASDEGNVGWDDGDDSDDAICTECFAAVQLQAYLRKMAGDAGADAYVIVDDEAPAGEGNLILIGNHRTNRQIARPGRWV